MAPQTAPATATPPVPEHDFMPLDGVHHVELYVGNALQAAYYYAHAFGFRRVAYRGLETGTRDLASHVMRQGRIRLVLTGALHSDSPIAAHHHKHGDGVRDIALRVPSVDHAYREATSRGAIGVTEPHELSDDHGAVRVATIETYGETLHTFVEYGDYDGPFLPGYEPVEDATEDSGMLLAIDHIVGNVELGGMDRWVKYYEDVFGMTEMIHFTDEAISTEYSALMSKVVSDGKGLVKFPINEPAEGKRKSQIDEYLEFFEGAGAQHIAVATRDIVGAVAAMRRRGVEFLTIPPAYYDEVPTRVPEVAGQLADLREQGILVDRDDEGYLLQIFTKPVGDRPTVFFEVIERHGARGFGDGNFKALFEAIEREQDRRGNL
ncbi:MAG: 4-hydroxyphenylpyruvate dioxygenase [Solirubrobacteraceae bacterium]|jgi:4-hydroxyphenylpyruvate dioxygenase|nr:4-hydroxyphenylpyruvate dioxygenase [Solirubrobacteraceae bacterium]MEA2394930.1 4-hydroxyphenylpyruvate dioxygenase [Solirubrobacteraceae bacterium]